MLWGSGARVGVLVTSQENIPLGLGWVSWILLWGRALGSMDRAIMRTSIPVRSEAVSITNDSGQRGKEKNSFKDEPLREREGGGGGEGA